MTIHCFRRRVIAGGLALFAAFSLFARPAQRAADKIERLIDHVAALGDVRITGGPIDTGPGLAAHFLRHDLGAKADQIGTAEDFIRLCATRSEQTGRAYEVVTPGGAKRAAAQLLSDALQTLCARGGSPGTQR